MQDPPPLVYGAQVPPIGLSKNQMKHHIDSKIDCVFKALLGSEENRNLLIHFLNAVWN
jgi:hypothetical protein